MERSVKKTEHPIITEHLDIRIVSEEPDADDMAAARKKMAAAADKMMGAPGIDAGAGEHAMMQAMGRMGLAMQGPDNNEFLPKTKRYLLIRKTGADGGEYARIDDHEADLLMHLLRGQRGHMCGLPPM